MYKKTILILLLFTGLLYGESVSLHPMVKSAILPGWGEAAVQQSKRARIFRLTEVSLVTACISAYTFSGHQAKQYKSFAVEHAGVDSRGKSHEYWVDLGNYIDMEKILNKKNLIHQYILYRRLLDFTLLVHQAFL